MTDNVVKFQPRPKANHGSGMFVELRLCAEPLRLEASLHDSSGAVGSVKFGLTVVSPPDFDVNLLFTVWDRLREPPEDVA